MEATNIQSFYGAYIRHVDLRNNGTLCRIDFSCDLTTATAEELECEDIREVDSIKRAALNLEPIPIQEFSLVFSGMEHQPLEALADSVRDFRVVRLEEEGGLIVRELRFHVTAPGGIVPQVVEYWGRIQDGKGQLTVRKIAQQEPLFDEQQKPKAEQASFNGAADQPTKKRGRGRQPANTPPPSAKVVEMDSSGVQ